MRNLTVLGAVVLVIGVVVLIVGNISWTETKPVLKAGPLQVNAEEEHHISVPTVAGVVIIVAGLGLVIAARR